MIQIFPVIQQVRKWGKEKKWHYENHLLINTQSPYSTRPSHTAIEIMACWKMRGELLCCDCATWLSFPLLPQIPRRLAVEQSQQAKLAGCLHHFIVCAPSKDLSRGPNTFQLMIKHQGQDNIYECRCRETHLPMKIFQGFWVAVTDRGRVWEMS